jgi:hypothetical protein
VVMGIEEYVICHANSSSFVYVLLENRNGRYSCLPLLLSILLLLSPLLLNVCVLRRFWLVHNLAVAAAGAGLDASAAYPLAVSKVSPVRLSFKNRLLLVFPITPRALLSPDWHA